MPQNGTLFRAMCHTIYLSQFIFILELEHHFVPLKIRRRKKRPFLLFAPSPRNVKRKKEMLLTKVFGVNSRFSIFLCHNKINFRSKIRSIILVV